MIGSEGDGLGIGGREWIQRDKENMGRQVDMGRERGQCCVGNCAVG